MPPQYHVSFSPSMWTCRKSKPRKALPNLQRASGNIWLLHREAWEGNSLYPENRQMQWDSFRKMTNHAQIQMELFTPVPPFLLFSCLLSLSPIFFQDGFWILISVTFWGNCNRCRLQANGVFSWSASVRCINWVLWLYIFKAHVGVTAMVPLLFELVTLCLRKVVSLFYTSFVSESWSAVFWSQISFCLSI